MAPLFALGKSSARRLRAEAIVPSLPRRRMLAPACTCCALGGFGPSRASADAIAAPARALDGRLDTSTSAIDMRMIVWRRDIHQTPELGNQEVRTAALVATHLKRLGFGVRERVAATGVVGTLRGGSRDGPAVALRADMDALPIAEYRYG